ncbi:hypothetical protein CRE_11899 [Caenorhabditis remanei]|uniref:Uncharacterized protein n=3 Tax=Caenorhabditis remanei TaxID=31234 RepID=E3M4D3_CAERE|nr:hypothetical protein CRE_11899 [Caenorhabditis remanei]
MRLLRLLILFFISSPLLCFSQHLQCYHCINRLVTSDITKEERNALKMALFARFNIPPSNEYCADGGSDILFRTVSREICQGMNDTCVRIISEGDEKKKLVIRGCQSTLVKAGYDLVTNYSCHRYTDTTSSECITTCQQPLCNISHGSALIPLLIILSLIVF